MLQDGSEGSGWTTFPFRGETGRLYHSFITFRIIFLKPSSRHQSLWAETVPVIATKGQNPVLRMGWLTSGLFMASPDDLAREHSPGTGRRSRRFRLNDHTRLPHTAMKTEQLRWALCVLAHFTAVDQEVSCERNKTWRQIDTKHHPGDRHQASPGRSTTSLSSYRC